MIRIQAWEYYWGYTLAQLELASVDAPFVAYKAKDKPKPGDPGFKSDPDKIRRDYERWKERQKTRKTKFSDFLGGGSLKIGNPDIRPAGD